MPFGQFHVLVAARRQPAHFDFFAGRHRFGAGDLRIVVVFGGREFARDDAGRIGAKRVRDQDDCILLAGQNQAVGGHRLGERRIRQQASEQQAEGDRQRKQDTGRAQTHFAIAYLPAAFRSASLMRSCQPAPPSWKYSSTSWSIRSETSSLTPGMAVVFGGASTTLVVVRLNAASASERASFRVLGRLG